MRSRHAASLLAATFAMALAACGGDSPDDAAPSGPVVSDPGPIHVHGLGIDPADGALFIATHTGLFRAEPHEEKSRRVANRYQDTMGFTVVGRNRFLGSGHPDGRDKLPPFLGLIRSDNAGRSWKPVSLLGKADFHVLEFAQGRIYGFGSEWESRREQFLVSDDEGRSWRPRPVPGSLISLVVAPKDRDHIVAASEATLYTSRDGGRKWRSGRHGGFLAWSASGDLYRIAPDGKAAASTNAGATWRDVGEVGGEPAAFEPVGGDLYVALHDGTIKKSSDGGRTWEVRSRP